MAILKVFVALCSLLLEHPSEIDNNIIMKYVLIIDEVDCVDSYKAEKRYPLISNIQNYFP